jgi:hypothetical protein
MHKITLRTYDFHNIENYIFLRVEKNTYYHKQVTITSTEQKKIFPEQTCFFQLGKNVLFDVMEIIRSHCDLMRDDTLWSGGWILAFRWISALKMTWYNVKLLITRLKSTVTHKKQTAAETLNLIHMMFVTDITFPLQVKQRYVSNYAWNSLSIYDSGHQGTYLRIECFVDRASWWRNKHTQHDTHFTSIYTFWRFKVYLNLNKMEVEVKCVSSLLCLLRNCLRS